MKKAKIYTRYVGLIVLLLFLALGVTLSSLFIMRKELIAHYEKIQGFTQALIPAERMHSALQTYVASDRGFLITGNSEFIDRLETAKQKFEEQLRLMDGKAKSERGKRLIGKIYEAKKLHEDVVEELIAKRKAEGITSETGQFFEMEVFPKRVALQKAVDALVHYKESELILAEQRSKSDIDRSILFISAVSFFTMMLLIGLAILLTRNLSRLYKNANNLQEEYRQLAENLERSNTELEHFAAIASHDLRSPLNTICGFGELLEEKLSTNRDEDIRKYMSIIVSGADKLRKMVDDLLDYARVNNSEIKFAPVELGVVVKEAILFLHQDIVVSGAQVRVVGLLPNVDGDHGLLVQVFQNVISNAIKYRKGTGPVIEIRAIDSGSKWEIVVEDDGIGIGEQHLEEVFHPFKRLHTCQSRPGTGLGLAICRRMIERHRGKIWISSKVGYGTKCHIALPKILPRAPMKLIDRNSVLSYVEACSRDLS